MRSVLVLLVAGCQPPALLSLGSARPMTTVPSDTVALEVITRGTAVHDPLTVRGGHTVVSGLEEALGHAVSTAAAPLATRHSPDGWQLTVELIGADARFDSGRLVVALNTRATLRTRVGRRYLAQTQAHCREAARADPSDGGPVFYACMTHIGRNLVDWLSGM
jgi:hypothetical protein